MNAVTFSSLPEAKKNLGTKKIRELIEKAHEVAGQFRQKETQLIEVLQELDQTKACRAAGYNSLFHFCVESLLLTEHQSYNYITVARKCTEIPELVVALEDRRITVSKARRMNSVINRENQSGWIALAEQSTQRDLERAVRAKDPRPPVRDHLQIISEDQVKLQATLDRAVEEKLRRVMQLLRDKFKGTVKVNGALEALCDEYLKKHDPVLRAERLLNRNKDKDTDQTQPGNNLARAQWARVRRVAIPAKVRYKVILRDKGQCRFHRNGERCESRQFLEIHHRLPVSEGGGNDLDNLVLLCSEHHKTIHSSV